MVVLLLQLAAAQDAYTACLGGPRQKDRFVTNGLGPAPPTPSAVSQSSWLAAMFQLPSHVDGLGLNGLAVPPQIEIAAKFRVSEGTRTADLLNLYMRDDDQEDTE